LDADSPPIAKRLIYEHTVAADGALLFSEGNDEAREITISGTLLTETQYLAFVAWAKKRYILELADDLDREWDVYVKTWSAKRKRSYVFPWRHEWTMTLLVLAGDD
jgi:hypothetical protein